ncbi:DUF2933 domain-containing protein [Cytobacillus sp. S13-E01]|uniref:DUF2933 domain-containing protein n=1 Tax=Cytobacillus sp. S13-E01 TaxID=3031326 RepID=UPI0023D86885|nr:DUF2933 domain-containing protein [Cytobacillus sp. S13-E01]MDF0727715.1 DUF2933 domain-containing protein [Cytobacillus sp. S13-E01]
MSWELLLLIACPLMMVFCMKGMFSGKKESKENLTQQSDLQSLQLKMADLMEQNNKLSQEMENLKNPKSEVSNVINLKKAQNS